MHCLRRLLLDNDPPEGGTTPPAEPPAAGTTAGGPKKDPAELGLGKRLAALEKKTDERFGALDLVVKALTPSSPPAPATPPAAPASSGGSWSDALSCICPD